MVVLQTDDVYTVILRAALFLLFFAAGQFLFKGYVTRTKFAALKRQGIVCL